MSPPNLKALVINGPNLNLLGQRQPEIYGTETLDELEGRITEWATKLGIEVSFLQTNHEGDIIDALHEATPLDGVVLNPGAYAHTSRAIADAIDSIEVPVIELHISNVKQREPWRADSVIEPVVARSIFGRGALGYRDALRLLANMKTKAAQVRFGPHGENVADLRIPDSPSNAVMLVHGGFWLQEWGRDGMDSLAVDLYHRGYATFNVEYRRSNAGGAWPGSGEDVWLAHHHLIHQSPVAGLPVTVIGHSAGGYLALHLAMHNPVAGVVALAPVTDLEMLASQEGPGRASAKDLLAAGAPPKVGYSGARVFHGEADDLVPVGHSRRLTDVDLHLIPGAGHFDLLSPSHESWNEVLATLP